MWLDGKRDSYFGNTAIELQQRMSVAAVKKIDASGFKEIRGKAAAPGKVTGVVKVLLGYRDAQKVKPGEILVATMTTPDYISAMEKAAAFVTDEGGVTCHAAIVAREFGVPCVVGTQVATKVLRDNDLVEVNAATGTVKIIKR